MRPVKYRAWLKNKKQMKAVESIHILPQGVSLSVTPTGFPYRYYLSEVELLEYTGKKDRNGVEIYDGDVVRVCWYEDKNRCLKYVVQWDDDSARFILEPIHNLISAAPPGITISFHYISDNWCEVVGNKFERETAGEEV